MSNSIIPENLDLLVLRQKFDDAFEFPLSVVTRDRVSVVLLQATTSLYAAMLSQVHEVDRLAAIAPLPLPDPSVLGVALTRGELVPAFCLARALALPGPVRHRLLLRLRHPRPIAVAIDAFHGHRIVAGSQVVRFANGEHQGFISGHLDLPDQRIPLLDLSLLATRLDRGTASTTP